MSTREIQVLEMQVSAREADVDRLEKAWGRSLELARTLRKEIRDLEAKVRDLEGRLTVEMERSESLSNQLMDTAR